MTTYSHNSGPSRCLTLRYCDSHDFPLPEGHKFPLTKYRLLREALSVDSRFNLLECELAERADVLRVHGEDYADGFLNGTLPKEVIRRIGFPWSSELVRRTLASAGATLGATRTALESGFGGTLAGGTHHAFRDTGSGFCVFNDFAMAIQWARSQRGIERAAIIDLDVHQGDGTASIFQADTQVFTLSLHGARNFPFRKQASSLDVELPDRTSDQPYLAALESALEDVWNFSPEIVFYQAGVDALETDRLGRLSLTLDGLRRRDLLVLSAVRQRKLPLVIAIGGGYSDPIEITVAANTQTFQMAAGLYCADALAGADAFHPKFAPAP